MKPIWIVDDDQSIRFVLEKALQREGLPCRSFTTPREVLQALDSDAAQGGPQVLVFTLLCSVLALFQNALGAGVAVLLGQHGPSPLSVPRLNATPVL